MPRTARRLYEFLQSVSPMRFYPEQLDVSFDFVPRMCVTGRFKTSHLWSVENQPVSYPSWPCLFPA